MQQTPIRQPQRKRERVTIRQVAKLANLSPTAVSMARANHPQISEETRMRVQQICRELGYEGKRRSAPSGRVGFVLLGGPIENPVNATLLQSLSQSTAAANLRLEISCIPVVDDTESVNEHTVELAGELDGLIITGLVSPELLNALEAADVPAVILGHAKVEPGAFPRTGRLTVVASDYVGQGQFATSSLFAAGHERVGFVSDIIFPGLSHARWLAGYSAAHGLGRRPLDPKLILIPGVAEGDQFVVADAIAAMPERERPTAFVVPDVRQAWVFVNVMRRRAGIEVPRNCVFMNGNPNFVQQYHMQDYPMTLTDFDHFTRLAVWHLQALTTRNVPCTTEVIVPFTAVNVPERVTRGG